MHKPEWINFAHSILSNWFLVRSSMYFILIKDIFYCIEKNQIMIKYQCSNKRIGDIISIEEFMQSPLKHATHPDQILQIGIELERQLNKLNKFDTQNNKNLKAKTQLTRFKTIFYNYDEIS